jgi:hypothetical protein
MHIQTHTHIPTYIYKYNMQANDVRVNIPPRVGEFVGNRTKVAAGE